MIHNHTIYTVAKKATEWIVILFRFCWYGFCQKNSTLKDKLTTFKIYKFWFSSREFLWAYIEHLLCFFRMLTTACAFFSVVSQTLMVFKCIIYREECWCIRWKWEKRVSFTFFLLWFDPYSLRQSIDGWGRARAIH